QRGIHPLHRASRLRRGAGVGAVPSLKRGWTLPELLVSLGITAGMFALAVNVSTFQLRLLRGVMDVAAVQTQLSAAVDIPAAALWSVSPVAGDIFVAQDSAIELRATVGSAVVCTSAPGRLTIPAPGASAGNALGGYLWPPEPDDAIAGFLDDSAGTTWLTLHVAAPPMPG